MRTHERVSWSWREDAPEVRPCYRCGSLTKNLHGYGTEGDAESGPYSYTQAFCEKCEQDMAEYAAAFDAWCDEQDAKWKAEDPKGWAEYQAWCEEDHEQQEA